MIAPKSWLSDFVSLSGISDERFAREMTFAGNKVESVQNVNGEIVYEFETTSNRPDTLSVIGLAREVSAVFDRPLTLPKAPKKKILKEKPIPLVIADNKLCPVCSVVEIDGIKIKSASTLVQKRLALSGIRPVNNIVDITNYVMLETGQPMHAFDADTLEGPLTVRAARPGERITPLDHRERILHGGEIIIEDKEKLVDLAGLMGGLNSEISEDTTRAYLLIPLYDPVAIRRASKYLRLRTEASTRFEKKIDLTQTESVALRTVKLLEKETGGKQSTAIVTHNNEKWDAPIVVLIQENVSSLVGRPFSEKEIETCLSKVGIENTDTGFRSPSWRRDIVIPVDLIEEVTRLHGYNKLQRTLPTGEIPVNTDALQPNWKRVVVERCAALGYTETYASTLIGKRLIEELGFYVPEQHLRVLHPMSEEYEYMRRTTLETLIPFLKQNLLETESINIFEFGTIFVPTITSSELPDQPVELGLISTTTSYAEFKGHIESIGRSLAVSFEFKPTVHDVKNDHSPLIRQVAVFLNQTRVGTFAQIHPRIPEHSKLAVFAASINMTKIFNNVKKSFTYPQISGYPPIIEDLTLKRPAGKYLGDALSSAKNISPLLRQVDYLGEYQQFVTLRLAFQSFERSLTQEEVKAIRKTLLKKLESLGWKLKS